MARVAFIAIFLLGLSIPAWQTLFAIAPETPLVRERRNFAPAPQIRGFRDLARLPEQFEPWFNDRFGFRLFLVRLKTQVDYSLFGTSARVHIGKDGWLFYRNLIDRRRFEGQAFYAANGARIVRNLERLNSALKEKGIALLVTVNLLADRFHPEVLPAAFPNLPAHPAIDDVLAGLQARLGPAYLDMTAVMNQTRKSFRVFHKSDFHWNDPAAMVGGQAIVERAAALTGRPAPAYAFPLEIVERDWEDGGVALIMPLLVRYQERELFLKRTFVDPPGFTRTLDDPVWTQSYRAARPGADLLPPLAFIGDSFTWGLQAAGLQAHFAATYMSTRWGAAPSFSDFMARLPDDTGILLVQWMEMTNNAMQMLADDADIDRALAVIAGRKPR